MKIGTEDVKSFMTLKYNFPGVRILEDCLSPTYWSVNVNLVAVDYDKNSHPVSTMQANGSIAYQKAYYWMESMLPGIILTNIDNKFGLSIATTATNPMMYCPGDPTDDLLVQLIHAKLAAITNNHLYIGEITLDSNDTSAGYTFCRLKDGYTLPDKVKDYVDLPSLHRKPWWHRDDGFCFEFLKQKNNKEKIADIYKDVFDPLKEFEEMLINEQEYTQKEPAEIIHVDKWKPKKV
jgi:hypothetical protein